MFDRLNCIMVDLLIQFSPYVLWAICFVFLLSNAVSLEFYHTYVRLMPWLTLLTIFRFCKATNGEAFFECHPYGCGIYVMQGLIPWLLIQFFGFIGMELSLFFIIGLHTFSDRYLIFMTDKLPSMKIK